MTDGTIVLPDGRKLGYAIYGSPNSLSVLYFHGTPSSRLELQLLYTYNIKIEEYLSKNNIRVIAVDRPGMGFSSFNQKGTFLSFADDVAYLLNTLHISYCPVMCWSGGGPYSLALAWKYPDRIKNVFILCGFTRHFTNEVTTQMTNNKWYFRIAKYTPWLLGFAMNQVRNNRQKYSIPQWITGLPDVDYNLLKEPEQLHQLSVHTFKEACRNGVKGVVHEARLYYRPFGFELSDIRQPVHFWWGTLDNIVIELHAKTVSEKIKNGFVYYKKGEGHLSLWVNCFTEVLDKLIFKE